MSGGSLRSLEMKRSKQLALGRVHLRDSQAIAHGNSPRSLDLGTECLAASEGDDVVDRQKKYS